MDWLEQKREAYILECGYRPGKVQIVAYDNTSFIVELETSV